MKRRSWVVRSEESGQTLQSYLGAQLTHPAEAGALIARGAVYVKARRVMDPKKILLAHDTVTAFLSESGQSTLAPAASSVPVPVVLFEDESWLLLDKPPGMTSQPTPGVVGESLWDWAKERFGRDVGLVHRLDKDTSGVVVLGKNAAVTTTLSAQFKRRGANKEYLAVTARGLPEQASLKLPISKDPSRPGRYRASDRANGQTAETVLWRVFEAEGWAGARLKPLTGRTHQIRAHLTALGFPIAGDGLYGGPDTLGGEPVPRCLLHAHTLTLKHPASGKPQTFRAPLPADFQRFWREGAPSLEPSQSTSGI